MSSTPLHSGNYPVYADPAATMGGGTPLIVAISKTGKIDDYQVTVKLQLLQSYERVIFELQQQVVRYKSLLNLFATPHLETESLRLESTTPLNAASVRLLDSIVSARIPNANPRTDDEGEL